MTGKIRQRLLPYVHRLERRDTATINLAVIHCTELPDLATARVWGERELYPDTRTGNSGHFYIDRDGLTEEWVPLDRVAHHVRGANATSVGIELVNTGRYPDWFHSASQHMDEPYPAAQIGALAELLCRLTAQLPQLAQVAGHADLDTGMQPAVDNPHRQIRRKLDPGPQFPWPTLLTAVPLTRVSAPQSE